MRIFHDTFETHNPANIWLFKVNNRNTRKRCEVCSKLTVKTPERRHWRRSGVFIVNFNHISHFFLEFLLLTLNKLNVSWEAIIFSGFSICMTVTWTFLGCYNVNVRLFTYLNNKVFSYELKILNYDGLWENKKLLDENQRFWKK